MTINIVKNLIELGDHPGSPNEFVYVKGFANPGDGGEGYFWLDPDFTGVSFPGMYITPKEGVTGMWIRKDYEFLSVKFFGAIGNGVADDTDAIENAIDFAYTYENRTIYIPNGVYLIDGMVLRDGIKITGELEGCVLKSSDSVNPYFIEIAVGPVSNVILENLVLDGFNISKEAIFVEARPDLTPEATGGLWNSRFSNITIVNFSNHGIHLKGGQGENYKFNLPNQFLLFERVRVNRNSVVDTYGLYIEGQAGQLNFLNCSFDGEVITEETAPFSWDAYIIGNAAEGIPMAIMFDTCTFQNSVGGIQINRSENIQILNCWFENLDTAINVKNSSRVINIEGSRFANATDYGGLTVFHNGSGYLVYTEGQSYVVFEKNVAVGDLSGGTLPVSLGSVLVSKDNYPATLNN